MLEKLRIEHVEVVFIPANCTSELQPLDLSVNKPLKGHLKTSLLSGMPINFILSLLSGKAIVAVKVDMSMSFIKPMSANCIRYVPDVK